jgi:plasmid maintenance system antidote protein VapI
MSFTKHRLSDDVVQLAKTILEKKDEFVIPEDIANEDQSDFVVAAAAAKKAGKKKFSFGGKEWPVTIKTDIKTEEKDEDEEDGKKNKVIINPELEEAKYDDKAVKMAIGVASDKRYKGGNYTGAVKAIEKIAKGLSNHPQVAAVLKRQNEDVKEEALDETGVAGEFVGKLKKYDSPKHEDDVEVIDNLPEGMMSKLHQMIDDGMTAQEIAKALKVDVKTIQKLMKEDKHFHPDHFLAIKEVFEEFMTEGTMAQGIFSRDKAEAEAAMDALKDMMRKKLPVGRDGSSGAIEDKIYSIVFDDELFDNFEELRDEKGDNADARPVIRARLKQLRVRV